MSKLYFRTFKTNYLGPKISNTRQFNHYIMELRSRRTFLQFYNNDNNNNLLIVLFDLACECSRLPAPPQEQQKVTDT